MVVDGGARRRVRRAVGTIVAALSTAAATGCLSPPAVGGASESESGSGSGGSDSGSTDGPGQTGTGTGESGELMTSTEVGTSEPPGPSCVDGVRNQSESDVDCGGPCAACSEGQVCSDSQDCATQACVAGLCVAPDCLVDADCTALDGACAAGRCDLAVYTCAAEPAHEGEACDDGSPCSLSSSCQAGVCAAGEPIDCSDFDSPCTQGVCDPETGACLAEDFADGSDCDDGDGCTLTTACMAGSCTSAEPGALFFEDFSAAAPGWEMDGIWEIGKAMTSKAGAGGGDPGDDRSPGDDGMLAGTAIGDLDSELLHPRWCLSSPPIDASAVEGPLWVSFWRHLHAPAKPSVVHTVDVWNGVTWKNLSSGFDQVTDDATWTFLKLNASGSQASDFRVRFCVQRLIGAPDFAGWSVDDVTVAPLPCTP